MSNPSSRYERMYAQGRGSRLAADASENPCGHAFGTAYIGNAAS